MALWFEIRADLSHPIEVRMHIWMINTEIILSTSRLLITVSSSTFYSSFKNPRYCRLLARNKHPNLSSALLKQNSSMGLTFVAHPSAVAIRSRSKLILSRSFLNHRRNTFLIIETVLDRRFPRSLARSKMRVSDFCWYIARL